MPWENGTTAAQARFSTARSRCPKESATLNECIACIAVLLVSILSSMIGIGGGALHVPLLLMLGVPFHQSVVTSQFVILVASLSATLVYGRAKRVDWKLALCVEPLTLIMAFIGGYFSGMVSVGVLKGILAVLLFSSACLMLRPAHSLHNGPLIGPRGWRRRFANQEYQVNLAALIPVTALAGLLAGAEGISGGILKVPAMVLLGGVPMGIATTTSALMVTFTAATGLLGHLMVGRLDLALALPLAVAASVGGHIGAQLASKVSQRWLRRFFAAVLILAAGRLLWGVLAAGL